MKNKDIQAAFPDLAALDKWDQQGLDFASYPALTGAGAWQTVAEGVTALAGGKQLFTLPGSLTLTAGEKQLALLGDTLVIYPDKLAVDTQNPDTQEPLDAAFSGTAALTLCDAAGSVYTPTVSASAPEEPAPGDLWLDTSGPPELKRLSAAARWVTENCCVRLAAAGIQGFRAGDRVNVDGKILTVLLSQSGVLVLDSEPKIPGSCSVTISRAAPALERITQAGGRLWGAGGGWVWRSAEGDVFNWERVAAIETPGVFTAAAQLDGGAVFFQENAIHSVSRNGTVSTMLAPGVIPGSPRSAAAVGGKLLYRGAAGVYSFDGDKAALLLALPAGDAVAAALGNRYYCSCGGHFLVYDGEKQIWLRFDDTVAGDLCACGSTLYALVGDTVRSLTPGAGEGVWRARLPVSDSPCWLTGVGIRGRIGGTVRVLFDAGWGEQELGVIGAGCGKKLRCLLRYCPRLDIILEAENARIDTLTAHTQSAEG